MAQTDDIRQAQETLKNANVQTDGRVFLDEVAQGDWLHQWIEGLAYCPFETRPEVARKAELAIRKHLAEAEREARISELKEIPDHKLMDSDMIFTYKGQRLAALQQHQPRRRIAK